MLARSFPCLLVMLGLLGPGGAHGQEAELIRFEDLFEWTGRLRLEETDAVLNVAPHLRRDPAGGWLVWDPSEAQVRLYDRDGRLRAYFGREGEGPGEFRSLVGATRIESGLIVAIERTGRVSVWSADGSEMIDGFNARLVNVTHVLPLGDSILVATRPTPTLRNESDPPTLHVLDISSGRITRSFLRPRIPPNAVAAMATVSGGGLARSDDALLVTLPLVDSLWVYDGSGSGTGQTVHLPSDHLSGPASVPDGFSDPDGMRGWLRSATFVGPVHAAAGTGWAILLLRYGRENQPGLLYLPPSRSAWFEIEASPVLLAIDGSTGEFLFQDPDALLPGRLRSARIRERIDR